MDYSRNVFLIVRTVGTRMKDKGKNIVFDMIYSSYVFLWTRTNEIFHNDLICYGLNSLNIRLTEVKNRIPSAKSRAEYSLPIRVEFMNEDGQFAESLKQKYILVLHLCCQVKGRQIYLLPI